MQTQIPPAVRNELEKYIRAHQALKSFSCRIDTSSKGIARPSGMVTLAFSRPGFLRLESRSKAREGAPEVMVCDGSYFFRSQPRRKIFVKARVPVGGDALKAAFLTANPLPLPIFSWLLTEAKPLEKLLSPEILSVKQRGEKLVNGIPTIVFLFTSKPGQGDSMLAFGKSDGLLRRVSVVAKRSDGAQVEIVEDYLEVKANPPLSKDLWVFTIPAGSRDAATPRPPLPPPPSLGPGSVKTASGLQYLDLKVGAGAEAKKGTRVEVHYAGALTDGAEFESSYESGQPFSFSLPGEVIEGWNEGLLGMRVGGKRKLVIPPTLGYGEQASGPIPANATLIFEIELLAVKG